LKDKGGKSEKAEPNAKHDAALSALLSSPTVREAAQKAKIGEATLWRYLREPGFREQYRDARRSLIEALQARLQARADGAAQALSDIAEDDTKPASARVAAARAIIESAIKLHEQTELEERLKAIEAALEAQKGPK
jgi:DNA-binding MurR/RpiR family transcriptional regulator